MKTLLSRVCSALIMTVLGAQWSCAQVSSNRHGDESVPQHTPARSRRIAPDDLTAAETEVVRLYEKALPTVVTIATVRRWTGDGGQQTQGFLGSGVLISPECHVLTAAHVVEGALEIRVKTQDGKQRHALLLFSDPMADIAVLQLRTPDPNLPHAELGDSDRLAVGQTAYVIGSPRGLDNSLSIGHISGFREFGRLYDGAVLAEFIQTDAAINSGNSGGPMFDSQGRVQGIASRILTASGGSEGLGFVVAINTAKQLLSLEDRVWIGVHGLYLGREQLAQLFNLDHDGGLLVIQVAKDSPAEAAGLRGGTVRARILDQDVLLGGDLILAIGDQRACHAECLADAAKRVKVSDRLPVQFLRDGKVQDAVLDVSATRSDLLKPR